MIKLRWMGTPDELVWFRRHLEEDQNLRLENVSRILPIRTSNRHFRMMGEVCIADPSEGAGGTTVKRYIRLSYLRDSLLSQVDTGKITVISGEQLSYLPDNEQMLLEKTIETISPGAVYTVHIVKVGPPSASCPSGKWTSCLIPRDFSMMWRTKWTRTMTWTIRMMPMSPDQKKAQTNESPASGPEAPVVRRKINGTTYLVKIHFNPDSKETLQDKLERMLVNEVNHPDPAA